MRKILKFFSKSIRFTTHYFFREPGFLLRYMFAYLSPSYIAEVRIMSVDDVMNRITSGSSCIRLGDGEVSLIHGRSIHFQRAEPVLGRELRDLVREYREDSRYIVAVPTRYLNQSNKDLKSVGLFRCWLPFKVAFRQFFPKDMSYADAHMFYVTGTFETRLENYLARRGLIICTSGESIQKKRALVESHFKNVSWVETPLTNSFDEIESVLSMVHEEIRKREVEGMSRQDVTVLVSTGPMGKVLAYRLVTVHVQCLDIGHGFETLYTGDDRLQKVLV